MLWRDCADAQSCPLPPLIAYAISTKLSRAGPFIGGGSRKFRGVLPFFSVDAKSKQSNYIFVLHTSIHVHVYVDMCLYQVSIKYVKLCA